jgi:hypothetical protein
MVAGREDPARPKDDHGDVQHEHLTELRQKSFIHHPIRVAAHEATHLREIADEGESVATPAILVGAVLAFVLPLAALLILLDLGVAHFS